MTRRSYGSTMLLTFQEVRRILMSAEFHQMIKRTTLRERMMAKAWLWVQSLDGKGRIVCSCGFQNETPETLLKIALLSGPGYLEDSKPEG